MTELIQDGTTEYYTDSEYWDTSYLMKKEQGKEPVLLDESDVLYLVKEGDFIYYTVVDYDRDWNAFLYRIKTDGTEKQSLGDTPVGAFTVYDDWIYYTNLDDGSKIYRMTVDGLKNEKIIDVPAKELICADGRIIFNGQDDSKFEAMMDISSGKIYMADLDGSNIIKITDNLAYDIEVVDNNVYYSNVSNNFELSSNKLSEGSNTVGLNVKSLDFDIIDGWIYYGSKDDVFKMDTEMIKKDFPTLHKIKLDGSGDVKLTDVPSTSIYVSENTIRYHEYADGGTMSYDIRHTEPRK